jgi:hypothetical protein
VTNVNSILIKIQIKNCFLSSLKALPIFFINQNTFGKTFDTCHQHTQLYQTILTCSKKITEKNFDI